MNQGGEEKALADALQSARKAAGLTQQELCHKAGISYSTLAKIERGAIKAPSVFTIHQIAYVLGITLDELVGDALPAPAVDSKRVSKSGVRFVFFDVNGCLVRFYHRAFTQIAIDSGKQADVIETTFWHYNDAVCRGELQINEYNQILGEQFGLSEFDWRTYYLAAIEPIKEMHELLTWASSVYHVGLMTNIMPGQVKSMIDKGFIPNLPYAAIIDSSEVHAIKPEPEIYQLATEKTGVEPAQILLVDDSRSNVMAAEKAGWKVLWFDDYRTEESVARVHQALEPAD
jgi:FMN phosphatase YigB (HAD superfamily)/DNA-binding XRE family transcriptional regulator